jgi:hypothetical protein
MSYISRWYGQGGHWINHGLPIYVAIDIKPENGCEIQKLACGKSVVMLRLKIVKSMEEETRVIEHGNDNNESELLHGPKVLKYLIDPWAFTYRVVCEDSYLDSVGAATKLWNWT